MLYANEVKAKVITSHQIRVPEICI